MDYDLPRPSQDGRVYWDSGSNDLVAQLRKTSIQTTPASPRLKRTSLCAGFPSPTRSGAHSSSDTSLTSNTSATTATSSSSHLGDDASSTSATSAASAGSRFSKRRRGQQAQQQPGRDNSVDETSGSGSTLSDQGLVEATLRRINEITHLLSLRNKQHIQQAAAQDENRSGASSSSSSSSSRPLHSRSASTGAGTALKDKSGTSNVASLSSSSAAAALKRPSYANAKPPLPMSTRDRTAAGHTHPQASSSSSSLSTVTPTASSSSKPSSLSRPGSTFGRSHSAQADVLGSRPVEPATTARGIRSSPAKGARPTSFPTAPAREARGSSSSISNRASEESAGDISLQDDSFDLALGSMADEDFDAMLQSASQQASASSSSASASSSGQIKAGAARKKAPERILPSDLVGPSTRSAARSSPVVTSQQKLRAPFKAPSRVSPPKAAPQRAQPQRAGKYAPPPPAAVPMVRVKSEPAAPAAAAAAAVDENVSQHEVHPELRAAIEAGLDFSMEDGDLSF